MILIITGFTFVCEVGAYILGIPVLSWLYGVNLKKYKLTLLLLLLCGGINAVNIIFIMFLQLCVSKIYDNSVYHSMSGIIFNNGYYDSKNGTYGSIIRISDTCIIAGGIIVSVYHYSDQEEHKNE